MYAFHASSTMLSRRAHMVPKLRMRDPSFPESIGQDYDYGQPLRAAHVGKLIHFAKRSMLRMYIDNTFQT